MRRVSLRTVIYSGEHALDHLNSYEKQRVFVVADPFILDSGMIEQVEKRLSDGDNEWHIFSDIIPDPPIELVASGVKELEAFRPDLLVAIGGGSAIDAAKAIKDFASKIYDFENIPMIAIPTTSGTGSEVTAFSVITDRNKGVKYPLVADSLIPEVAILDTELVKTVPKAITADTGMDTLTHAIEAYVATDANDFTDAMAEKAIRLVFDYLPLAYHDGTNQKAREKMHHASTLAGIAFNTAGLGINHSIAHACGAKFHIPHGRLNAILLPEVIRFNAGMRGYQTNLKPAAEKYAELAKILGLPATNHASGTRSLIREIEKLRNILEIPRDFKNYDVDDSENVVEEIAETALMDSCTETNPAKPEKADIINILEHLL